MYNTDQVCVTFLCYVLHRGLGVSLLSDYDMMIRDEVQEYYIGQALRTVLVA